MGFDIRDTSFGKLGLINEEASDIDQINEKIYVYKKTGQSLDFYHSVVPFFGIYPLFFLALIKNFCVECPAKLIPNILLLDTLLPIPMKKEGDITSQFEELIGRFQFVKEETLFPTRRLSNLLPEIFVDEDFIYALQTLKIDEINKDIGKITYLGTQRRNLEIDEKEEILPSVRDILTYAIEYVIGDRWGSIDFRTADVSFIIFGEDKLPVYRRVRNALESHSWKKYQLPLFLCIKRLFGEENRDFSLDINMSQNQIKAIILNRSYSYITKIIEDLIKVCKVIESAFLKNKISNGYFYKEKEIEMTELSKNIYYLFSEIKSISKTNGRIKEIFPRRPLFKKTFKYEEFPQLYETIKNPMALKIYKEIYLNPGLIQTEIADKLNTGSSSIKFHIDNLIKCDLIKKESDTRKFFPKYLSFSLEINDKTLEKI